MDVVWMDRRMTVAWMDDAVADSYCSVGGDFLSWRRCVTPMQRGRSDELVLLRDLWKDGRGIKMFRF